MTELVVSFYDADALGAFVAQQLAKGMVFLPDAEGVEPLTTCTLVLELHGRRAHVPADVVYARSTGPGRGVGLQLGPLGEDVQAQLRALAEPEPELSFEPPPREPRETEPADDDVLPLPLPDAPEGDAPLDEVEDDDDDASLARAPQLHERMRHLTSAEQQRLATSGTLQERTMLERLYGPTVWEALLASGRLSPPEVARIARKGTVPKPLLEMIGANGAWLASALVQRALLSNPRCPATLAQRVLQSLPRRELALVPQQTAYPMAVRQAAKALLKR
jgi:hypothetical protein